MKGLPYRLPVLLLAASILFPLAAAQPAHTAANGDSYKGLAISSFASNQNYDVIIGLEERRSERVSAEVEQFNNSKVIGFGEKGSAVSGNLTGREIRDIARSHNISYVERDGEVEALVQNPSWGWNRVDASSPVSNGVRGEGVDVAVIDTGLDDDHPDLNDNIAGGRAWVTCSSADTSNTCNFNWTDDQKHGTHVGGIIAAEDNNQGIIGVAPNASIHGYKVLDYTGSGSLSDVADALVYAADQDMDIASLSLGASIGSTTLENAVEYSNNQGTTVVVAAGNAGPCTDCVDYPAKYKEAIAVAATNSSDMQAGYSSQGPEVDIAAPGSSIRSTVLNGNYQYLQGTSMATPFVSGVAALLESREQGLTPPEIKNILYNSTEDIGLTSNEGGYGLLDAEAAVNRLDFYVTVEDPENRTYTTDAVWLNVSSTAVLDTAMYTVDGGPNKSLDNYSDYYQKKVTLSEGSHSVEFYLEQGGTTKTKSVDLKIDSQPPEYDIESPSNTTYYRDSIDLNYSITDTSEIEYCKAVINSEKSFDLESCGNISEAKFAPGVNNLTLKFGDVHGNNNSKTVSFTVENLTGWEDSFRTETGVQKISEDADIKNNKLVIDQPEQPSLMINEYFRGTNDSIEVVSTRENLNIAGYEVTSGLIDQGGVFGNQTVDAGEVYFKAEGSSDFNSIATSGQTETVKLLNPEGEVIDCLSIGTAGCNFTLETGHEAYFRNRSLDRNLSGDWNYSSERDIGSLNPGQKKSLINNKVEGTVKSLTLRPQNLVLWDRFQAQTNSSATIDLIDADTNQAACSDIQSEKVDECLLDTDAVIIKASVNGNESATIENWNISWKQSVSEPAIDSNLEEIEYRNTSSVPLEVSADKKIYDWKYATSNSNTTFTPNTSINLTEGVHNVTFWAQYTNTEYSKKTDNITIDLTDPEISQATPHNKENISGLQSINASISDSISGLNNSGYVIENGSILKEGEFNSTINTSTYSDGKYSITYSAIDLAGNKLEESRDFWIDNTRPFISINISDNDNLSTSNPSISLNSSEPVEGTYKIDSNSEKNLSNGISVNNLSEGSHSLQVWAEDSAGNQRNLSKSFTVDTTEPVLQTEIKSNKIWKAWYKDSVNVSVTCSDSFGNISELRVSNNDERVIGQVNGTIALTEDGQLNHTLSCYDYAENSDTEVLNLSIDSKKPSPTSYQPSENTVINSDSIDFTANIAEASGSGLNATSSKILFDGEEINSSVQWSNSSVSVSVTGLDTGDHTIQGFFSDNVGHESNWSYSFSYEEPRQDSGGGDSSDESDSSSIGSISPPPITNSTDEDESQTTENEENSTEQNSTVIRTGEREPVQVEEDLSIESISTDEETYIEIRPVEKVDTTEASDVYRSWDIKPENKTSMDINFTVERSWIEDRNATVTDIVLLHKKKDWVREDFNLIEREEDVVLKARLENFSIYTIGLEKNRKTAVNEEKNIKEDKPQEKGGGPGLKILLFVAVGIGSLLSATSAILYIKLQENSLVEKTEILKEEIKKMEDEEKRIYRSNLHEVEDLIEKGHESRAEERIDTLIRHARKEA